MYTFAESFALHVSCVPTLYSNYMQLRVIHVVMRLADSDLSCIEGETVEEELFFAGISSWYWICPD